MDKSYDYIIVGGGTAGCILASRLSKSLPESQILLLENGSSHTKYPNILVPGYYLQFMTNADIGYGQQTAPQSHLNNRTLTVLRGKVLGGGSCVNFLTWARGPKCDWDYWANLVDDEVWNWDNVLSIYKNLETFNPAIPDNMESYASPTPGAHGTSGPIGIGYGTEWMPLIDTYVEACNEKLGCGINRDYNDGNVIGASVAQFNIKDGERVTSSVAFINNKSDNLTVITEASAERIIFEEGTKRAVGVEAQIGKSGATVEFYCTREVIVSCGTLGSPALLLRSGISPSPSSHIATLPVGQNLTDHLILSVEFESNPEILSHHQIIEDEDLAAAAEEKYRLGKTGDLVRFGGSAGVTFARVESIFDSKEFRDIKDEDVKAFLKHPERPTTEIWQMSGATYSPGPRPKKNSYLTFEGLVQNCLSRGTVTLDPADPHEIIIDPQYCSHPYDMRACIETVRAVLRVSTSDRWHGVIRKMVWGPEIEWSPSLDVDAIPEEVLETFVRNVVGQGLHQMSTCVMGKAGTDRVVDPSFKVQGGVQGLRVVDLSVCPVLTNNHTQTNAYVIGEVAARKILDERGKKMDNQEKAKL